MTTPDSPLRRLAAVTADTREAIEHGHEDLYAQAIVLTEAAEHYLSTTEDVLLAANGADSLVQDFHDGVSGTRDVDVSATVHAVISDVIQSAYLALYSDGLPDYAQTVKETLEDYVANYYGDL